MKKKKLHLFLLLLLMLCFSCNSDDESQEPITSLEEILVNKEFVVDNVIACAASNENAEVTSIFLYPRPGVTNINYFETESLEFDKNDFSAYTIGEADTIDVFNGFLLKYEIRPEQEKWVVVTFEEDGMVHLSNPIRIKHLTKPTEYIPENVTVASNTTMPIFTWIDGAFDDSRIYFHIVSDNNDNLLSGTYTFDKMFQYYNLENVVLNITEEEPPNLVTETNYNFTLLAVSEDNWVNLFSTISFNVQ